MMEQDLQEAQIKPNKLAFQVALAFAVYTIVIIYVLKLLNIDTQQENVSTGTKIISTIVTYVPFILAIMYTQIKHKADLGGFISYGRSFSAGFKVSSYAGLFAGILMIIYYKVLDRDALAHIMSVAVEKAGDNEQAVEGVKKIEPYMAILIAFSAAITYTILGLFISLISSAFIKKEKPLHFEG